MNDMRVKANEIELQVRGYEHEGDAIIFLHFSGANLMMWQPIVPFFRDRYRLLLVDLRGHGKSDQPETGYHMDEMARDVTAIMERLELERAHVIGSSLGAEVGLSLAASHPQRVTSLVCDGALASEYGPYGTWLGSEAEFEAQVARKLDKIRTSAETIFPSVDALVDHSRAALQELGWWNEHVEAMVRYGACSADGGGYRKSFGRRALESYMSHYYRYRLEDYYRRVRCPLLMLPDREALTNQRQRAAMQGLKDLAAFAEIEEVAGWMHPYGWLLSPEAVCRTILRFVGDTAYRLT